MALRYVDMADDLFDVEGTATSKSADGNAATEPQGPVNIVLRLQVQPGAGRASIVGRQGDALRVRVAPPPLEGRANAACVAFVAELFDVPSSSVELVSGERNRRKRVRIENIEVKRARAVLEGALERAGRATSHDFGSGRPAH
jgi:uncharacterized protein (TIGR00251 family)